MVICFLLVILRHLCVLLLIPDEVGKLVSLLCGQALGLNTGLSRLHALSHVYEVGCRGQIEAEPLLGDVLLPGGSRKLGHHQRRVSL